MTETRYFRTIGEANRADDRARESAKRQVKDYADIMDAKNISDSEMFRKEGQSYSDFLDDFGPKTRKDNRRRANRFLYRFGEAQLGTLVDLEGNRKRTDETNLEYVQRLNNDEFDELFKQNYTLNQQIMERFKGPGNFTFGKHVSNALARLGEASRKKRKLAGELERRGKGVVANFDENPYLSGYKDLYLTNPTWQGAPFMMKRDYEKRKAELDALKEREEFEQKVMENHERVMGGTKPADMPTVTPPAQSPNNMPVIDTPTEQTAKMPVVPDNSRTNISSPATRARQQQEQQQNRLMDAASFEARAASSFGRKKLPFGLENLVPNNPGFDPSSSVSGTTPQAEAGFRESASDFGKDVAKGINRFIQAPAIGEKPEFGRSVRHGYDRAKQAAYSAYGYVGEDEDAKRTAAKIGKELASEEPLEYSKINVLGQAIPVLAGGLALSAGGAAAAKPLGFGALGKALAGAALNFPFFAGLGLGSANVESQEQRGRELTTGEAITAATAEGALNTLPFAGRAIPPAAKKSLAGKITDRAKRVGKFGAAEGLTEGTQQVIHNVGVMDRPASENVGEAIGEGSFVGGFLGFGGARRRPIEQSPSQNERPDVQARRGGFGSKPFQPGSLDYLTPRENTAVTRKPKPTRKKKRKEAKKPKVAGKQVEEKIEPSRFDFKKVARFLGEYKAAKISRAKMRADANLAEGSQNHRNTISVISDNADALNNLKEYVKDKEQFRPYIDYMNDRLFELAMGQARGKDLLTADQLQDVIGLYEYQMKEDLWDGDTEYPDDGGKVFWDEVSEIAASYHQPPEVKDVKKKVDDKEIKDFEMHFIREASNVFPNINLRIFNEGKGTEIKTDDGYKLSKEGISGKSTETDKGQAGTAEIKMMSGTLSKEPEARLVISIYPKIAKLQEGGLEKALHHELGHGLTYLLDPKQKADVKAFVDKMKFPANLDEAPYKAIDESPEGKRIAEATGFTAQQAEKFSELFANYFANRNKGYLSYKEYTPLYQTPPKIPKTIKEFFDKVIDLYNRMKAYVNDNLLPGKKYSKAEFDNIMEILEKGYRGDLYKEATAKRPIEEILAKPLSKMEGNEIVSFAFTKSGMIDTGLYAFSVDRNLRQQVASALRVGITENPGSEKSGIDEKRRTVIIGTDQDKRGNKSEEFSSYDLGTMNALENAFYIEYNSWRDDGNANERGDFIKAMYDFTVNNNLIFEEHELLMAWRRDNPDKYKDLKGAVNLVRRMNEEIRDKIAKTPDRNVILALNSLRKKHENKNARVGSLLYQFNAALYRAGVKKRRRDGVFNYGAIAIGPIANIVENPGMPLGLAESYMQLVNFPRNRPLATGMPDLVNGQFRNRENWRDLSLDHYNHPDRIEILNDYMSARRALDSPHTVGSEGRSAIKKVYRSHGRGAKTRVLPQYEDVHRRVSALFDQGLELQGKTGIFSAEDIKAFKIANPNYFPNYTTFSSAYKGRRTKSPDQPISDWDAIMEYSRYVIESVAINEVRKDLAKAEAEYGTLLEVEEVSKAGHNQPPDFQSTIREFSDLFGSKDENNKFLPPDEIARIRFTRSTIRLVKKVMNRGQAQDRMIFYKDGKAHLYHIIDPEMMLLNARLGPKAVIWLDHTGDYVRRAWEVNISKNPLFVYLYQFPKDAIAQGFQGHGFINVVRGVFKGEGLTIDEWIEAQDNGLAGGITHAIDMGYLRSGLTIKHRPREIALAQKRLKDSVSKMREGNPQERMRAILDYLAAASKLGGHKWTDRVINVQNLPLRRAYAMGLKKDLLSPRDAAKAANEAQFPIHKREFTWNALNVIARVSPYFTPKMVGFNAMATKVRMGKRYVAHKALGSIPAVSERPAVKRYLNKRKIKPYQMKWVKRATFWTGMGFIGSVILGGIEELMGVEEEDNRFAAYSTFMTIKIGDSVYGIPSAWDTHTYILNPGRKLGRALVRQTPEAFWNILGYFYYAFQSTINPLPPPSVIGAFELGMNQTVTGNSIVPRDEEGVSPYFIPTQEGLLSSSFAKAWEDATGMKVHPRQMKYAVEAFFPMISHQILAVTDMAYNLAGRGTARGISPIIPFIKDRFYSKRVRDAWELYDEARLWKNEKDAVQKMKQHATGEEKKLADDRWEEMIADNTMKAILARDILSRDMLAPLKRIEEMAIRSHDKNAIRKNLQMLLIRPHLPSELKLGDGINDKALNGAEIPKLKRWLAEAITNAQEHYLLKIADKYLDKKKGEK